MTETASAPKDLSNNPIFIAIAWSVVGGPLAWGVVQTLYKAALLFQ
jgi:hypothetical protein